MYALVVKQREWAVHTGNGPITCNEYWVVLVHKNKCNYIKYEAKELISGKYIEGRMHHKDFSSKFHGDFKYISVETARRLLSLY